MNTLFTIILYVVATVLLVLSFLMDQKKTLLSLKRAWNMFTAVLPQFISVLLLVGLILAVLQPETIQNILGTQSGFLGMLISALVGAVTLIPVLIAFPLVSELLKNGAGIAQMAVFIAALTTVGFVTLPLEIQYLGKKVAVLRNLLFFLFAFITSYFMGVMFT